MSDSEVHKRLLALRGKLFNKDEVHKLDLCIDEAIDYYNLFLSSDWTKANINYCYDEWSVYYSINKKYQLSMNIDYNRYQIKFGTKVVFGQGYNNKYLGCMPQLAFLFIPDSVCAIMKKAFYKCRNLQQVVFGNGLKIIQDEAFANCKLKFVTLPEGIYSLGDRAFANNTELESVYIPYTLQVVGIDVFKGCSKLSTIYVDKGFKDKVRKMFPKVKVNIEVLDYKTWDEYNFKKALEKSTYLKENSVHYNKYDNYTEEMERRKDFSDEEDWYGLTDGMNGDYPTDIY